MDNLGILIQAILSLKDTEESKKQIINDLPKLEGKLQSDEKARVKIIAGLDTDKSRELIESQIGTLFNAGNAPTIKVGVDVGQNNAVQGIVGGLKEVQNQAQNTRSAIKEINTIGISDNVFKQLLNDMQINKKITDEYKTSLRNLATELKMAWDTKDEDQYRVKLQEIIKLIGDGQVKSKEFAKNTFGFNEITSQIQELKSALHAYPIGNKKPKVYIDDTLKKELAYIQGSDKAVRSLLNSLYGLGNWTFNERKFGFVNLRGEIDKAGASVDSLYSKFSNANFGGNNVASFIINSFEQINSLSSKLNNKSTMNEIIQLGYEATESDKQIERLIADILKLKDFTSRNNDPLGWFEEITTDINSATSSISTLNSKVQEFRIINTAQSSKNYFSNSDKILKDIQLFNAESDAVRILEDKFKSLDATITTVENKSADGQRLGFTAEVKAKSGEIERFNYQLKDLNAGIDGAEENWKYVLTNIQATDKYIQTLIKSQSKYNDKVKATADTLEQRLLSTYSNASQGSKPIQSKEHWSELGRQAGVASEAIEKLRQADETTFTSLKANVDIEIAKLKDLVRQYQNVEYAAESLRTKDVNTVKNIQTQELDKFINKINGSKVPLDTMTTDVNELRTALANIGDKDSLTRFLNQFDTAKAKFESFKTLYQSIGGYQKQIETAISSLTTLNNSTVFRNNSSNPQVTQTKQELVSLRAEYQQLLTQLQSNPTSQGLETLRTKLTELDNRMKTAVNSAKAFEKQLRSDNSADQLAKKVNVLTQQMKAYQATNTKAAKAYKQQFSDMFAILSNPNIDNQAFTTVQKQFQALRQEAIATGKAGKTMFQTIGDAVKKFAGWMSMTQVVSQFASELTTAIKTLKDVDDILTEISKTSDLTAESLVKLGKTSFTTASKYGKNASDYLVGVQEMYRAGFGNAEKMSELSILAQAAGDLESTPANDYIIATNAAYKLKGNVEELNKVLDSQNYITNNAAVSMKDMSDATSEAASIASQYGVEIDELSALIAVAVSKTRESGSEIGTALKALFINLQDTTSKPIQDAFDAVNISMTKMVNGVEQLKTPIELIKELSVAFNSLPEGDIKRANILNDIGGKHHANVLSSILSDLESYYSMLELYNSTSAENSAFEEAQKSANNLSGSLNKLSNTWTDIVDNIVNADDITNLVDVLNDILNIVNFLTEKLGTLGTIGLGAGIFAGVKNVGRAKMYVLN